MGTPAAQGAEWLRPHLRERRLRLASGLIMALYLFMHFTNIATGLVSVDAMDAASPWLTGLWSSGPGLALLSVSLAVHFGLTLKVLYGRRTLQMSGREGWQLFFGLLFPFLLVAHIATTKVVPHATGRPMDFVHEVYTLWVAVPLKGGQQMTALVVGWAHVCIGLWFWLRAKPWFPRAAPALLAAALIVPLVTALGFVEAGRDVARNPPPPYLAGALAAEQGRVFSFVSYAVLAGAIAGVLLLRAARAWAGRSRRVRIRYPDGRSSTVPAGFSILEASRAGRIPHVSVCGGRGRCSTCRVRVLQGLDDLPPPNAAERATLARLGAGSDVRLACQLRPTRDVSVSPIFAPSRSRPIPLSAAGLAMPSSGVEREIAVLFCDLRGFTRIAERMLPYDTVFLLNRYFELVGAAVEASGGHLDKFIGDGALALFGLDKSADVACRQALRAAGLIARGLDDLNAKLQDEHGDPLRVAMGLHVGPTVVGQMGYGQAVSLTAVGDGINVASRLETAAKDFGVDAVISATLALKGGADPGFETRTVAVRGRSRPVEVHLIRDARALDVGAKASAA